MAYEVCQETMNYLLQAGCMESHDQQFYVNIQQFL